MIDNNSDHKHEDEELFEHFNFIADVGQQLLRVDKFLINLMRQTSRNRIQKAAEAGAIRVNGVSVKSNYRVRPGDRVALVLAYPPRVVELLPENLFLDIIYKDSELAVVNKPSGMVVHPSYGHYSGTLVNGLLHEFQSLPEASDSERPGLVHRIDKDTTGILVVARNEFALAFLAKQFADHTTEREYHAIAWGNIKQESGTIIGNVGRSLRDRKMMSVFPDGKYGKEAATHFKVLERFGFATLVSCRLETGRTHQIRVHFQSIGHSLFGDQTYGGDKIPNLHGYPRFKSFMENNLRLCPRQALHARLLGFVHPTTLQKMKFEIPIANDIDQILDRFRVYTDSGKILD
jgi:23S rRNA pseudouridine1911/1915/1917 synthase